MKQVAGRGARAGPGKVTLTVLGVSAGAEA